MRHLVGYYCIQLSLTSPVQALTLAYHASPKIFLLFILFLKLLDYQMLLNPFLRIFYI